MLVFTRRQPGALQPRLAVVAVAGLLVCLVVFAASLARPPAAAAADYYELRARHSDKCLDVAHLSFDPNAYVIQGDCWGGRNQQWRFVGTDSGYHEVIVRHSGMCLAVNQPVHGARARQVHCTGSSYQQWIFVATDGGYYRIVNRRSDKCLDVAHLSIAHGANVIIGDCWSPGPNQQWKAVFAATA